MAGAAKGRGVLGRFLIVACGVAHRAVSVAWDGKVLLVSVPSHVCFLLIHSNTLANPLSFPRLSCASGGVSDGVAGKMFRNFCSRGSGDTAGEATVVAAPRREMQISCGLDGLELTVVACLEQC